MFILLFADYSNGQETGFGNLWGEYIVDKHLQISLNICENNKWYFTTCTVSEIPVHETKNKCDIIFKAEGDFSVKDSLVYLKDKYDTLCFSLKVVDTLNLQVVYAKNVLKKGDYLNRTMSFFPGHLCASYLYNFELIRWIIFDDKNEIWRFNTTGGIFGSKDYKVDTLQDGYWKKNNEDYKRTP